MAHPAWIGGSVAQLTLVGAIFGSQNVTVHHFQTTPTHEGTLTTDTLAAAWAQGIADTWVTTVQASYCNAKPSDYSLQLVRAQVIERPGQRNYRLTPYERAPGAISGGGATGSCEEPQSALVLRWRTARAGKSFRGRSYLGPLTAPMYADGRLLTPGLNAGNTYATAMEGLWGPVGTSAAQTRLSIYSRPYDQGEYGYVKGKGPDRVFYFPPDYAGVSEYVTGHGVDPILRVQRRRQIGVGA